jgi:hypothetical protein
MGATAAAAEATTTTTKTVRYRMLDDASAMDMDGMNDHRHRTEWMDGVVLEIACA